MSATAIHSGVARTDVMSDDEGKTGTSSLVGEMLRYVEGAAFEEALQVWCVDWCHGSRGSGSNNSRGRRNRGAEPWVQIHSCVRVTDEIRIVHYKWLEETIEISKGHGLW